MTDRTPGFTVFKDARNQWRWLAFSSNAYQDRDGEIVSTKALAADVVRADADRSYGPLRWWHIGQPNPFDIAAPWGPGVDLGWCDFNAMAGRVLIESGTFDSEQIGAAIAAKANTLGISIGFIHPLGQPSTEGIFTAIRRFERSLAPREQVSNPFTVLTVRKETRPMDAVKLKALADVLGISVEEARRLYVDQASAIELKAQSMGLRFKVGADQPITANPKFTQLTKLLEPLDPQSQEAVLDQCLATAQQAVQQVAVQVEKVMRRGTGLLPWPW